MSLATIILPNAYQPGDEVQPLAMLKQPLFTEVRLAPDDVSPMPSSGS